MEPKWTYYEANKNKFGRFGISRSTFFNHSYMVCTCPPLSAIAGCFSNKTGNHSDEVSTSFINDDEFNTLNAEHLDCEFVDTDESFSSLPDLIEGQELTRTTFRALNESEQARFKKYSHVDTSHDSSFD